MTTCDNGKLSDYLYHETERGVLYCGDCLDIMPLLADKSVDLVLTDPPYKTTARGSSGNSGGMLQKKINRQGLVFNYNDTGIRDYVKDIYRCLNDDSHCYIMTNHTNLTDMLNVVQDNDFRFTKCLIWNKGNKIMGQYYMSQFEYILFLGKGKGRKINYCQTPDILLYDNDKTQWNNDNIHDTEKPVGLFETLISNSSNINNTVLDPFAGSGTTAVACINTKRRYILIEKDDKYCAIAKRRIETALDQTEIEL